MIRSIMLSLVTILMGIAPLTAVYAADDLCPEVDDAKRSTPNDVAGVQSDIDRLNLCVERAKLLKQLDDIAKQRADTLAKITGAGLGSFPGVSGVGMPPLPAGSLPPLPTTLDTSPLKPGEKRINAAQGAPLNGTETASVAVAPSDTWKIRKIWGQAGGVAGATMKAQISNGSGSLLNVIKGDPLPDGKVVEAVSIKGVTLSQNGKIIDLSWDSTDDSGTAAGSNDLQTTP
jgi:hypothetical protein